MRIVRVSAVLLAAALVAACGSGPIEIAFSDLVVTVETTGARPSTGYRVLLTTDQLLSRDRRAAIPPNGSVVFEGLIGDWTVSLTEVEDGCAVQGPSTRTVELGGPPTVTVDFTVHCSE